MPAFEPIYWMESQLSFKLLVRPQPFRPFFHGENDLCVVNILYGNVPYLNCFEGSLLFPLEHGFFWRQSSFIIYLIMVSSLFIKTSCKLGPFIQGSSKKADFLGTQPKAFPEFVFEFPTPFTTFTSWFVWPTGSCLPPFHLIFAWKTDSLTPWASKRSPSHPHRDRRAK